MSLITWTTHSLTHLVTALARASASHQEDGAGRRASRAGLCTSSVNKKTLEDASHTDRDQQFEQRQAPAISADCKKQKLLGIFEKQGRAWLPKGQETRVNISDYRALADGFAIPYGIYDLVHHIGEVPVGLDHETAECAVERIRRWCKTCGSRLYQEAHELLITAEGGESLGVRNKLWMKTLQRLANEERLTITFAQFPATTEPRGTKSSIGSSLSSPSGLRAKPLTSLETVIALFSPTTTTEGLHVTAIKPFDT